MGRKKDSVVQRKSVLLQLKTVLNVIDNSGVLAECIRVTYSRPDGRYIRFDNNACILLNNKLESLDTRILGVIGTELRGKKWGKVVSLASSVI
ncbi:8558_t:CDS:2 [Acaulospora morrowiae]|uniref:8558_t:CDS:1 n=1 Tax=Acaulospora morrowiae TaxID=94023 RepID=A0A9N9EYL4_9GLOM|nr:8558_t:CDS:2 [Acaulospora morrowiae]